MGSKHIIYYNLEENQEKRNILVVKLHVINYGPSKIMTDISKETLLSMNIVLPLW